MNYLLVPILLLTLLLLLFGTFFIVKQQSAAVIERFGKFVSTRHSGLQLKIPVIDRVAGRLSLRIQQLDVVIETKTKDDVFVKLKVSVQYKVIKDKVYDAFYKLDFPEDQITSYVFDVVRAEVPKMILDDVFEKKDDIAIAVKALLCFNPSLLNPFNSSAISDSCIEPSEMPFCKFINLFLSSTLIFPKFTKAFKDVACFC